MAVVDKIMSIYYGEDKLPYKDIDRQVHYPIGNGDIFVGENNTTKIRFYVDKIGGSAFTWLATVKLPDGSLVYQLTSSVSDTGYVEVDISGFYTEIVGNIFVSLTGFVADDVNIVEEDGTYEVSGNPARLVTGSVKIVINYAPLILNLGADITTQQYEQLLGLIATKMAKIQGIPYYANITDIKASEVQKAELKDNQIVFDTASSSFYKYSTDSETFTKVDLDIDELSNKVDKIWQPNIVYGTNGYPEQVGIVYTNQETANTIMSRDANGRAKVNDPLADKDIANKKYVDDGIDSEVSRSDNKYETKANHSVDIGHLQNQIDAIISKSDVVDIVGTYNELLEYDKSKLGNNDIIKVLTDEAHANKRSYYRFNKTTDRFTYIGSESEGMTESEAREIFLTKVEASSYYQRKVIYSDYEPTNLQVGDIWINNGLYDDDTDYTLDYADLTNKPKINDVVLSGNKTLAQIGINDNRIIIKQGGTQKGTFTLNQDSDTTIELDEGGTSFELVSYDSTKSYALYEIFLYDGTVGMTTVAHSAEAFNSAHNKLFASKYVEQDGQSITFIDLHDAVVELDEKIDDNVDTLEGSIDTIGAKIREDVAIKQTGNTFTYSGDTVTYNKKYKNLNTGTTTTDSEVLTLANSTTAGLMSPSSVTAIQQMRNEIDALENQNIRLLYTTKSNPTANEIKAFVVSSGYTDETLYAGISVVVQATNNIWKWVSNTEVFNDFGLDTVSQFTNTTAGVIKGSATDGKIYAEDDGTGSVYGWSALKNLVNSKANDNDLSLVAKSGMYNDLGGKPHNLSDFSNDVGYITSSYLNNYYTTTVVDSLLSDKADKENPNLEGIVSVDNSSTISHYTDGTDSKEGLTLRGGVSGQLGGNIYLLPVSYNNNGGKVYYNQNPALALDPDKEIATKGDINDITNNGLSNQNLVAYSIPMYLPTEDNKVGNSGYYCDNSILTNRAYNNPSSLSDAGLKGKYTKIVADGMTYTPEAEGGWLTFVGKGFQFKPDNVKRFSDYTGYSGTFYFGTADTTTGRYALTDYRTYTFPDKSGTVALDSDLPVANPSGTASATLNKLQIGNTIYSLPSGGGGEGTSDYTELTNKPQINNVELSGNKSASDLGLLLANKVSVQTTAPTSAISDGGIHIVVLSAEPTTKYDGYIYFIEEQ